jgi:hypothetical protein
VKAIARNGAGIGGFHPPYHRGNRVEQDDQAKLHVRAPVQIIHALVEISTIDLAEQSGPDLRKK